MKKLWDLKNVFSNLELEGQGPGIIMGVTRLLLLGPFYSMQTNFFAHDSNPLKNQNGTTLCQVIFLILFGLFTKPEDPMSFVWGGRPLPAGSDVMNEGCAGIPKDKIWTTWVLTRRLCIVGSEKGQLISKAKFLVLIWTKNRTKLYFDFWPSL